MKQLKLIPLLITIVFLTACGGSSATSGNQNSSPSSSSQSSSSDSSEPQSSESSSESSESQSSESSSIAESSSSSSSSASSSSAAVVNPLPEGAGIYTTSWLYGDSYQIKADTGVIELQPNPLHFGYRSADIDPDGFVIASLQNDTEIHRIDFNSGNSELLFDAPEVIQALAVSDSGIIVGVSEEEEFDQKTVYRFNMEGEVLSTATTDAKPSGIDFMPDGTLIAVELIATNILDAETGDISPLFETFNNPSIGALSDIDIDSEGHVRAFADDQLVIYDLNTGTEIDGVTLQQSLFSFSPIVYR